MSGDVHYCVNCGARIDPDAAPHVCPACGKDPAPEEHLFRYFLWKNTKDKIKSDVDSKLFDIIKNWLLSHLFGFVLSIAVIAAVVMTIYTAQRPHGVPRISRPPASVINVADETAGQPGDAAGTADDATETADAAAENETATAEAVTASDSTTASDTTPEAEAQAAWWPFGSKRWTSMTRSFSRESTAYFTYNYDERGRLTSVESSFIGEQSTSMVETDSDGRWLRRTDDESVMTYSYDADGRLVSMVLEEYSDHDGEGVVYEGTDTYIYTYDGSGKIVSATVSGTGTTSVDGVPDVIEERSGTVTYFYDENNVLLRTEAHIDDHVSVPSSPEDDFDDVQEIVEEYGY